MSIKTESERTLWNNCSAKDSPFQSEGPTTQKTLICCMGKRDINKTLPTKVERATTWNIPGSAAEVSKVRRSNKDRQIKAMIQYEILCLRRNQWSTSSIFLQITLWGTHGSNRNLTQVVIPLDENFAIWLSKLIPPTPMTSIWSAGLLRVL